ncbi:MAG: hypothetical protein R3C24_07135 [Cyanobacteriota/Melainabacteria group bacterium]
MGNKEHDLSNRWGRVCRTPAWHTTLPNGSNSTTHFDFRLETCIQTTAPGVSLTQKNISSLTWSNTDGKIVDSSTIAASPDIYCGHQKYSMIKSEDFYERVVNVLNSDERFELVLGEPIETIRSRVAYVEVTTDRRIVKAK